MGHDRSPVVPDDLARETKGALRGVQLFHSGNESHFYRPVVAGDVLDRMNVVHDVEDKQSEFAGRSVIVTNKLTWANQHGEVVTDQLKWFVHAERRKVKSDAADSAGVTKPRRPKDETASYTDEQLAEIESAYDNEYRRGGDTLWFEDVEVGATLPTMVKGPLTVTDLINMHMDTLSYDMNRAMRLIASLTVIVGIPSLIGSILGANTVDLPFSLLLWQVVFISVIAAGLLALLFYMKGWLGVNV